jgi:uncharacterized membrane protein YdbT with pleckstrin-like domain
MSDIKKYLGRNEKVILDKRPARRGYLGEYLVTFATLALAILSLIYRLLSILNDKRNTTIIYTVACIIFFTIFLVLFIKLEIRIRSKRYTLTTERIILNRGIISEKFWSSTYDKITDMELEQSFTDKILDTGTLKIDTSGTDSVKIAFENISRPFDVKNAISNMQEYKANKMQAQYSNRNNQIKKK